MTAEKNQDKRLDDLLKDALADDLPNEVAAGMRNRIAAFRVRTAGEEKSSAAFFWLFRKGLWAFLAIGMLASGFLLQGLKVPNPLADRIALIKTEISNPDLVRPPEIDGGSRIPGGKES